MNCAVAFYDKFRERIAGVKTISERNSVLSEMQEVFQRMVRNEPENRNALSEVYQMLKLKCWEA